MPIEISTSIARRTVCRQNNTLEQATFLPIETIIKAANINSAVRKLQ
jgi:hypothetical protein